MTDKTPTAELGLLVTRYRQSWSQGEIRVNVKIVRRTTQDDIYGADTKKPGESIRNCGTTSARWQWPEKLQKYELEDLKVEGHVYAGRESGNVLIGFEARFHDVHQIELREAERILKTLKALQRARDKWHKENPGLEFKPAVQFLILAKFVNAKFVVFDDCVDRRGGYAYDDHTWDFCSLREGVHKYLSWISKLERDYVDPWKPRAVAS